MTETITQDRATTELPPETTDDNLPAPTNQTARDRDAIRDSITTQMGGMELTSMLQVVEVAKLMAQSGAAVPKDMRGNAGMCFAVCLQALEWRMSPFSVANKAYVVNDRLGYEAQLIHAVVESRAPLIGRLRYEWAGEGETRTCTVTGQFKGESAPHVFTTEPIANIRPKKNSEGKYKGSPLWETKPDVQLAYNAVRDWARLYCPDVIMGVYSTEELAQFKPGEAPGDTAQIVNTSEPQAGSLHDRLKAAQGEGGYQPDVVENGLKTDAPAETRAAKGKGSRKRTPAAKDKPAQAPAAASAPDAPAGAPQPTTEPAQPDVPMQIGREGQDTGDKHITAKEPEPQQADREPEPKHDPTTPAEYAAHVDRWLQTEPNDDAIEGRWAKERKLRNACGVTQADRDPIRARVDSRIDELKTVTQ